MSPLLRLAPTPLPMIRRLLMILPIRFLRSAWSLHRSFPFELPLLCLILHS